MFLISLSGTKFNLTDDEVKQSKFLLEIDEKDEIVTVPVSDDILKWLQKVKIVFTDVNVIEHAISAAFLLCDDLLEECYRYICAQDTWESLLVLLPSPMIQGSFRFIPIERVTNILDPSLLEIFQDDLRMLRTSQFPLQIQEDTNYKIGYLSELDLGNRGGNTDYIDFLKDSDLTADVMIGSDRHRRQFIVVRTEEHPFVLFQRYTDNPDSWIHASRGRLPAGLSDGSSFYLGAPCTDSRYLYVLDKIKSFL